MKRIYHQKSNFQYSVFSATYLNNITDKLLQSAIYNHNFFKISVPGPNVKSVIMNDWLLVEKCGHCNV